MLAPPKVVSSKNLMWLVYSTLDASRKNPEELTLFLI
jgi:hypothetical protein